MPLLIALFVALCCRIVAKSAAGAAAAPSARRLRQLLGPGWHFCFDPLSRVLSQARRHRSLARRCSFHNQNETLGFSRCCCSPFSCCCQLEWHFCIRRRRHRCQRQLHCQLCTFAANCAASCDSDCGWLCGFLEIHFAAHCIVAQKFNYKRQNALVTRDLPPAACKRRFFLHFHLAFCAACCMRHPLLISCRRRSRFCFTSFAHHKIAQRRAPHRPLHFDSFRSRRASRGFFNQLHESCASLRFTTLCLRRTYPTLHSTVLRAVLRCVCECLQGCVCVRAAS